MNRPMVESYRSARADWEARIERKSNGYAAERADAVRDDPCPLLRDWMRNYR
jgi:hypothetical protein